MDNCDLNITTEFNKTNVIKTDHSGILVYEIIQGIGARENQEDAFGISDLSEGIVNDKGVLFVLADGMGGMAGGEYASSELIMSALSHFDASTDKLDIPSELEMLLLKANEAVRSALGSDAGKGGTTALLAHVKDGRFWWAGAGDSRIYHFTEGELQQLNTEHVYARTLDALADEGRISREEAMENPRRRALTSYIGIDELTEMDISAEPVRLIPGDMLILMSDGVFETLTDREILNCLRRAAEESHEKESSKASHTAANIAADSIQKKLISKQNADQDNYTCLIIERLL